MKEKGKNPQVLHMKNYKAIFEGIESTLIKVGSANLTIDKIISNLDKFKHYEDKDFSDDDYYWILVYVIFYSGFKAATVSDKLKLIRKYFPDYETVTGYDEKKVKRILGDPDMIRNRRKVLACIENAKVFKKIVGEYGSFKGYIDSFSPTASFENLMLLKEELEYRFKGLGRITTYHVLTDIGLPVLKPDRVICRIFKRLGLIESDKQLLKTVILGRKFAQATGHPIRYIDIVFVAYGQRESKDFGLTNGICLERPLCSKCGVRAYCNYFVSSTEGLDSNSRPMKNSLNSLITNPKKKRFAKMDSRAKTSFTHGGKRKKFKWYIEDGNVFIIKGSSLLLTLDQCIEGSNVPLTFVHL